MLAKKGIVTMVKKLNQLNNGVTKGKPIVLLIDPSKLTKLKKELL